MVARKRPERPEIRAGEIAGVPTVKVVAEGPNIRYHCEGEGISDFRRSLEEQFLPETERSQPKSPLGEELSRIFGTRMNWHIDPEKFDKELASI